MSLMSQRQRELQVTVALNKQRAHFFKETGRSTVTILVEKQSVISRENMKILNKLVEISKGKQVSDSMGYHV
jgi:predicted RND superfamily exporter protein